MLRQDKETNLSKYWITTSWAWVRRKIYFSYVNIRLSQKCFMHIWSRACLSDPTNCFSSKSLLSMLCAIYQCLNIFFLFHHIIVFIGQVKYDFLTDNNWYIWQEQYLYHIDNIVNKCIVSLVFSINYYHWKIFRALLELSVLEATTRDLGLIVF